MHIRIWLLKNDPEIILSRRRNDQPSASLPERSILTLLQAEYFSEPLKGLILIADQNCDQSQSNNHVSSCTARTALTCRVSRSPSFAVTIAPTAVSVLTSIHGPE